MAKGEWQVKSPKGSKVVSSPSKIKGNQHVSRDNKSHMNGKDSGTHTKVADGRFVLGGPTPSYNPVASKGVVYAGIKSGSFVQTTFVRALIPELTDKPESHLTTFEKMDLVRSGVSKKGLEQLKTQTVLDYDKLAKMLSTTKVTLINKKGDEKFSPSLSEKILSLADVYSYGYEVFEDADKFNSWMLSPIRALGGKAPYEIMDNQFGREEVRNIIGRIAYGIFS